MNYSAKTSFDFILKKFHHEIWVNNNGQTTLICINEQISCLKVLFLMMHEFNFFDSFKNVSHKLKSRPQVIKTSNNSHQKAIASHLGYYFFIDQIKTLADYLDTQNLIKKQFFPQYYQIKIFRDKASQHWIEYVDTIGPGKLIHKKGATPIPIIHNMSSQKIDIEQHIKNICQVFLSNGIKIEKGLFGKIPRTAEHLFISNQYHQKVLDGLVSIHKKQRMSQIH